MFDNENTSMTKEVLVMVENEGSFITNSIVGEMSQFGINGYLTSLKLISLAGVIGTASYVLLNAEDFAGKNFDHLMSILSDVSAFKRRFILFGHPLDLKPLKKVIPDYLIAAEYERPIEIHDMVADINTRLDFFVSQNGMRHILAIDDSGPMLRTIMGWLEGKYKVSLSNSGANAMNFLKSIKPDLILLDYEMPIYSGAQVFMMLKAEPHLAQVPVIFLTTNSDIESVKKVLALNPAGYLLKTTPAEDVVAYIDQFFVKQEKGEL